MSGMVQVACAEPLLAVPGGIGPDLVIGRTYNSLYPFDPAYGVAWTMDTANDVYLEDHGGYDRYFTGPSGWTVKFAASDSGGTRTYTTPSGLDATLKQNADGSHTLVFHQSQTSYEFENPGGIDKQARLTAIKDRNGRQITFAYNTGTRDVATITDNQGRTTSFAYSVSRVTQMTDAAGRTYGYTYNGSDELISYLDPAGKTTTYAYGTYGMTQVTTPGGRVTKIAYYPATSPNAGKVQTITRVTNTTAGTGPTTTFDYVERRDGSSDATVTDPAGHQTRYVFDESGRVLSVTDALGNKQSQTYNSNGNVLDYTAPGATGSTPSSSGTYDALNNLTGTKTAVGARYLRATSTFPTAGSSSVTGGDYLPTESRDTQGLKTTMGYTSQGNLSDIGGYDAANNLTSTVHLDYADAGWPGKVTSSTDGRNQTTAYFYDSTGNLTSIEPHSTPTGGQPGGTSPSTSLGATTISYGGAGGGDQALSRPTTVTLPNGRTKSYTYDNLDRVTRITYSDSSYVNFSYDEDGNLTQVLDSVNATRTFGYDALNRITSQGGPGSYSLTYGYDPASNLTSFVDPNGTTEYGYDAANRLVSVYVPGVTTPVKYTRDEKGNATKIEWPNSVTTEQSFNEASQMLRTCVRPAASDTACSASTSGRLLDFTYAYEQFAFPDSASTAAQKALQDTVTDKDGKITKYCYGGLNRLLAVDVVSAGTSPTCPTSSTLWTHPVSGELDWYWYAYDGAGNITSRKAMGATDETYQYNDANELTSKTIGLNTISFSYEADGATGRNTGNESAQGGTGANRTASTYNVRNQTAAFTVSATTTNLKHFGDGQDDLYEVGSTTHRNTTLGLTQIGSDLYTRDNAGSLVSQSTGNGRKYFHLDALGSVRGLTGSGGTLDYKLNYDPYGRALTGTGLSQPGSATTRFGFASGEWISEASYYHFGARYYDPALLRWTMPDPLLQPSDPGQANRFVYASGNAVNWTDPSGQSIFSPILRTVSKVPRYVRSAGEGIYRFAIETERRRIGLEENKPGTYKWLEEGVNEVVTQIVDLF